MAGWADSDDPCWIVRSSVRDTARVMRLEVMDLRAHQIANRKPQGEGKADLWSLSAFARERLDAARSVPEMSEDLNEEGFSEMSGLPITHPHRVFDDFSEKVPERGEA